MERNKQIEKRKGKGKNDVQTQSKEIKMARRKVGKEKT